MRLNKEIEDTRKEIELSFRNDLDTLKSTIEKLNVAKVEDTKR